MPLKKLIGKVDIIKRKIKIGKKGRRLLKIISSKRVKWMHLVEKIQKNFCNKLIELPNTNFRANMFYDYSLYSFEDFGSCFRFVLYPARETPQEIERYKEYIETMKKLKFTHNINIDYSPHIGGGIEYFGININYCKGEERPTALINTVEARGPYYKLRSGLRDKYQYWDNAGLRFLEEKMKKMGFKRIAIIPSTELPTKVPESVAQKYYEELPKSQGYYKKILKFKGIVKRKYYVKELN